MKKTVYWLQGGGCGGDTHSLLNVESPDLIEFFQLHDLQLLWHPALSNGSASDHRNLLERVITGEQELSVLIFEGSVLRGPGGTGMYDLMFGKPKKDWLSALAHKAQFVVAAGTCASFGGIGSSGEIDATGVQFTREEKGGFLGDKFKSWGGLPVVNLPGCPCHPEIVTGVLAALSANAPILLDNCNRPFEWYGMMVHQGCTRNEYHEYRVEEKSFGDRGCLFFHMGCHGPLSHGPCNKLLWNRRSSKTRVGVPCVGCTNPDFPQPYPFFQTPNIEGIPLLLPEGISRPHYMAYKGMAAAAVPRRLKERKNKV